MIIAFAVTLLGGVAMGFMLGIVKGLSLGMHFRTDRPVSPIPWILCAVGAGMFLLVAIGTSIYSLYFLSSSVPTEATITEIIERENDDGSKSYSPVYTYTLPDGQSFTERSTVSDGRRFQVGDTVPIRYLKASPHQSRMDYFMHHWFLPILLGCMSVGLGAVAAALRWWREKEQRWLDNRRKPSPTDDNRNAGG